MRIRRIKSIKNIGSFIGFDAASQLENFHDKWNIFYGMNGCGKTTLSEIFRSISEGKQTKDIESKLGIGQSFCIETDAIEIKNTSIAYSNIKVFNKYFVEENVFCKEGAVPLLHLGKENDQLQKEHDQLIENNKLLEQERKQHDQEKYKIIAIKDSLCQERAKFVKGIIGGNYNKGNIESNFSSTTFLKITKSEKEIELLKKTISANKLPVLDKITLNIDTIKTKYDSCDMIIRKNITNKIIQGLTAQIEGWIKIGLDIHKNKGMCEFCNNTISKTRLDELEGHFNDDYNQGLREIDLLISSIPNFIVTFQESGNLYPDLTEKYIKEKQEVEKEIERYKGWKNDIIRELTDKKTKMSEGLKMQTAMFDFSNVESLIIKMNGLIETHNKRSQEFDKEIQEAKKILELHYISEIHDEYVGYGLKAIDIERKISKISGQMHVNNSKIKEISEQIKPEAIALIPINSLIQRILGRDDISLIIKDAGYQIVRDGNKPFSPSEGEKTVIGLAYFINKLIDQKTATTDIILFDDPVTSLDEKIFYNIYGLISSLEGYQMFILTHHFQFLRLFIDQLGDPGKDKGKYYRISARHEGTTRKSEIINLEQQIYKYHSEYEFLFRNIYDFIEKNRQNPSEIINIEEGYSLANMARKVIEIFGSIYFPKDTALGNKLRRCLERASMGDDYNEIYRFINNFSHSNSLQTISSFDTTIYTTNVWSILEKIMKMIQIINNEHYIEMANI